MKEFDFHGRRLNVVGADELNSWIGSELRPNVAATFTLLQARRIQCGRMSCWLKGDAIEYGWAYDNLIHDLSERFNGRAYRRYGKLVPNVAVLEGDGEAKRFHIHSAFRCPERLALDDYIGSIKFHWCTGSPWMMGDVKVEPITGRWAGYTVKEGSEALLLKGMSL